MPSPDNSPDLGQDLNRQMMVESPSGIMNRRNRGGNTFSVTSPNPGQQQPIATSQWQISRIPLSGSFFNGVAHPHIDEASSPEEIFAEMADRVLYNTSIEGIRSIPSSRRAFSTGPSHGTGGATNTNSNARSERRRSRAQSSSIQGSAIPTTDQLFTSFFMQLNGSNNGGSNTTSNITNNLNNTGTGAQGFEAIAANLAQHQPQRINRPTAEIPRNGSALRHKLVYLLHCTYCERRVCWRAMKAILLADTKIELYSTDIPPDALHLLQEDRMTQGCHCRIRDTVCRGCGNVLGYHVSQPCERCLDAKNNGHFWMFYSETVRASERPDPNTGKALYWGALSPMREIDETIGWMTRYETFCR